MAVKIQNILCIFLIFALNGTTFSHNEVNTVCSIRYPCIPGHGYRCPNSITVIQNLGNGSCETDVWTNLHSKLNHIHSSTFTFNIKNVSTNSDIIFKSQLNDKIFFNISQNTINRWVNVQLSTPVINFVLPPHAYISFEIKPKDDYHNIIINKTGSGLIASPSFGGVYEKGEQRFFIKAAEPYRIQFKFLFIDKNEHVILLDLKRSMRKTLNITFPETESTGQSFEIRYTEKALNSSGFLLQYTASKPQGGNFDDEKVVETIDDTTVISEKIENEDDLLVHIFDLKYIIIISIVVILLCFVTIIGLCIKCKKNQKNHKNIKNSVVIENNGYEMLLLPNSNSRTDQHYIPQKNIRILNKIAGGVTSDVYIGVYENGTTPTKVAIKNLKLFFSKDDILKEVKVLCSCKHPNIVTFIGWMEQENGSTSIVTEYLSGGDLNSYLVNPEKLLMVSTIFSYIFQVLDAMIYLSHKHILHRDLAARNCLLNGSYEILKITDFGLAREMDINYEYVSDGNPRLPIRWLPLEAFESSCSSEFRTFTYKGDIWSFGILIWEMFTRGKEMYCGLNLDGLLKFLKAGSRLPQPDRCPLELYTLMLLCWDENPEKRPTFDKLQKDIENIHLQIKTHQPSVLNICIEKDHSSGYEHPRKAAS